MNWTLWWVFVTATIFLAATPGPAVLLVLATGVRYGVRKSLASTFGILSANLVYFALSATSLGAMLAASRGLFVVIKWVGAAYLVFEGIRSLLATSGSLDSAAPKRGNIFGQGFLLQAANPNALIYFSALLPQFVDTSANLPRQMLILAITSTVVEFVVLFGYGIVAGKGLAFARQPRYAVWTRRVSGVLLIAAAVGIALLRR